MLYWQQNQNKKINDPVAFMATMATMAKLSREKTACPLRTDR
jgi:hypothetical protein